MSTTATLEDRIAILEQRLDDLELPPDNLQPNYLTLGPDGTVGANFSGTIQASELDLLAGASPAPINWKTAAGALVAQIESDGAGNLTLSAARSLAAAGALFSIDGLDLPETISGSGHAPPVASVLWGDSITGTSLQGVVSNTGRHSLQVKAGANHIMTLFDDQGGSSLAQVANNLSDLPSAGTARANLGIKVGTQAFAGNGTATVQPITVPHGLTRIPAAAVAFAGAWAGATAFATCILAEVNPADNTNLYLEAFHPTGVFTNGQTYGLAWIAIG